MIKLHRCLGLAILALLTLGLSGCKLYFGDDTDDGGYCAADGYYVNGEYVSAMCPDGQPPGTKCEGNAQCAAGCYCENGVCEEAGFCSTAADCPPGYMCDGRSSCVPNANPTCDADSDCLAGSSCENGHCDPTCACETDQQAIDQGFHHCDEARSTCENAADTGSCVGAVTCTTAKPSCPVGSVPLVANACWADSDEDGRPECSAIGACDLTPVCASRQHEADCTGSCEIVKTGINCTMPGGGSCQPNVPGCQCTDYIFNSCR